MPHTPHDEQFGYVPDTDPCVDERIPWEHLDVSAEDAERLEQRPDEFYEELPPARRGSHERAAAFFERGSSPVPAPRREVSPLPRRSAQTPLPRREEAVEPRRAAAPQPQRPAPQVPVRVSNSTEIQRRGRAATDAAMPAHANTLSPSERAERNATLQEKVSEYITLKHTIEALTSQKDELSDYIKAHLDAGDQASAIIDTPDGPVTMRPVLRVNKKRVITFSAFVTRFGEDAARRAATIDLKAADALAKKGEIDPADLKDITEYALGNPALYIVPVEERKAKKGRR